MLVHIISALLRPGGHLLVITGSPLDPYVGLAREELESAFVGSLLEFIWLRQCELDAVCVSPLAWSALLRKGA